ncbi:TraX family protein [Clostridium boliviensis]|uniref:TraX family protein n=1 Tax=Clostridium boliviensis TaxID=318465 RepID=A0ABU4GHE1_9CLOT|nr:TraX family protein [Clostridium boliviensis]MDW2796996.1 TraX family protein [Clostridium boliviensis]
MTESAVTRKKGITGNALKMIAIITMLIDHIGAVVIENGILKYQNPLLMQTILATPEGARWSIIDFVLRTIGRIAFPIFCFLLVEGFLHTRDVKKYGIRLLVFALISEIPFDLAVFDSWFHPGYQNVFFTLLIGLWVLVWYQKAMGDPLRQFLAIGAGCGASILLKSDYNIYGIVLILIIYIFRDNKKLQAVFTGITSALISVSCFGAGALSLVPIHMYNGKKGERNLKYLFYWFYPLHLILLYILRLLITG